MSCGRSGLSGVSLIELLDSATQPSPIVFCGNVDNHVFMRYKKGEGFDTQHSVWVYLGVVQVISESVV